MIPQNLIHIFMYISIEKELPHREDHSLRGNFI